MKTGSRWRVRYSAPRRAVAVVSDILTPPFDTAATCSMNAFCSESIRVIRAIPIGIASSRGDFRRSDQNFFHMLNRRAQGALATHLQSRHCFRCDVLRFQYAKRRLVRNPHVIDIFLSCEDFAHVCIGKHVCLA
jgi:hypothetical protein